MKKNSKRVLSVLLALLMTFSVFGMTGFAESMYDWSGVDAIRVAGQYSVLVIGDEEHSIKFVPDESGVYNFNSSCKGKVDPAIEIYDANGECLASGDDAGDGDWNFDVCCYLTAGEKYFLSIRKYNDGISMIKFDVLFFGNVKGVEVNSLPEKRTYVIGGDIDTEDDEYGFWVDFAGLDFDVTFESGIVCSCFEYGFYDAGITYTGNYDKSLGKHEITFMLGEEELFSYDIDIVDTPVSSIEIVELPDKLEYIDGYESEAWFNEESGEEGRYTYVDDTGMKLRINLKDGKSKTVTITDFDYETETDPHYVGGYWINTYSNEMVDPETNEFDVYVEYLGCKTSYKCRIVESPVEKVEILNGSDLSCKYLVDGYTLLEGAFVRFEASVNCNGLKVKITRKDGTEKVVTVDDYDSYEPIMVDGYKMYINADGYVRKPFETVPVSVYYVGASDSVDVMVRPAAPHVWLRTYVQLLFQNLFSFIYN